MEGRDASVVVQQSSQNDANMKQLMTVTEYIERSVVHARLGEVKRVENSSEDVENAADQPWCQMEILLVLGINMEENVIEREHVAHSRKKEQKGPDPGEVVLVEVRDHHQAESDKARAPQQAEVE